MSSTRLIPAPEVFAASPAAGGVARRWDAAVPWLILAVAATLRLLGLDKSLWLDEADSYAQATAPDFLAAARSYDHPPLYFALLRGALHFTHSFPLLRLISVAAGLAAVALFCFWPDRRQRAGTRLAALLLAVAPPFVAHAQELRQYALLSATFSLALACAWQLTQHPENVRALLGLSLSLLIGAGTHLLTIFFAAALAAWLLGVLRHASRQRLLLIIAGGFLPAAVVAVLLKTAFLLATNKTPDSWWMPGLTADLLIRVFRTNAGWDAISRFSYLAEDLLPFSRYIVLLAAAAGGAFLAWTAFGHRRSGSAWGLQGIAVFYWAALVVYSLSVTPIVWPRTMLPGMVPCFLALGIGIAENPARQRRFRARVVAVIIATCLTVPWLHGLAWRPIEELRGLTMTVRANYSAGDLLTFIDGVDAGLKPYWPELPAARAHRIDLSASPGRTLADLRAHQSRDRTSAVLLVYRDDLMLAKNRPSFDALVQALETESGSSAELWNRDGYHVVHYR